MGYRAVAIIISSIFWLTLSGAVQALSIISPLLELDVNPGTEARGIVKVFNETDEDIFVTGSVEAFRPSDAGDQPIFLPPEAAGAHVDWFSLDQEEILIRPRQAVVVPFTVRVPPRATPGGYYAAIFWQSAGTAPARTGVSVQSRVGTLVLLTVTGELFEAGELQTFGTVDGQSVFFGFPVTLRASFQNTGNIHLRPQGEVTITSWLGRTETIAFNQTGRYVLPDSSRRFDVLWHQAGSGNAWNDFWQNVGSELSSLAFGPYTATLELHYGDAPGQLLRAETSFWFAPLRALSVLAGGIIMIFVFLTVNAQVNRLKKRKKHHEKEVV